MKKKTFLDKLANQFGYIKEIAVSSLGHLDMPAFPNKKTIDYLKAYAGWVYACVKARSVDTSRIKLKLYKIKNRETGEVEEVMDHEILSLLRTVNPWMTFRDLVKHTQAYRDLTGEAFWYLMKSGTNEDNPDKRKIQMIVILRPDYISIRTDEKKFIKGYTYEIPGGEKINIPADQIIHHKEFNPTDPYRGMGVVQAAALSIDTDDFAKKYNRKFFINSAIPSMVLSTEQKLNEDIIKRMRAQWHAEYGGVNKSNKMAILEGGLEVKPFTMSQKDMEFLSGRNFSRDEIFAMFQTPKSVLGMTENVTVSNAQATDMIFAKRVIKPAMEALVDTLNEFLLPQYTDGQDLFFSFDDPVPVDKEQELKTNETLWKIGAMSQNEIRAKYGMDEVEGLDNYFVPLNVIPVNREDGENEEPVKGVKKPLRMNVPVKTLKQKLVDDITNDVTGKLMNEIRKGINEKDEDDLKQTRYSVEQQEAYWKVFVKKSENYEGEYKKRLKDIFKRQEKETLERLENTQKALRPKDINDVLIRLPEENKASAEVLIPVIKEMMESAGNDQLDFLGLEDDVFDTTEASVREFTKETALKGIKGMNKTTKGKLRNILKFGISEGRSIPQISRDIRGVFKDASTKRAEKIARTEILKAANFGSLEAMKQSGVVAGKEWFTSLDEKVCQWCGPMHGKIKRLDANYFNQGESFLGKEGGVIKFNLDDILVPPLHPLCRCTLIPIVSGTRSFKKKSKETLPEFDKEKYRKEVEEDILKKLDKTLNE